MIFARASAAAHAQPLARVAHANLCSNWQENFAKHETTNFVCTHTLNVAHSAPTNNPPLARTRYARRARIFDHITPQAVRRSTQRSETILSILMNLQIHYISNQHTTTMRPGAQAVEKHLRDARACRIRRICQSFSRGGLCGSYVFVRRRAS